MKIDRYAANMAEIFIVLVVLFLIQAVLNFSLTDDETPSKKANLISLSIRQIPSGGVEEDHLAYFFLGDNVLKFPGKIDPVLLESTINSAGKCVSYSHRKEFPNTDNFASKLASQGIEYKTVKLAGMQAEHLFTWDPKKISEFTTLIVGFVDCRLPINHNSLGIDSHWNLKQTSFKFPHPLIVTISRYTEYIKVSNKVIYYHKKQFPNDPFIAGGNETWKGLSFLTKDCSVSNQRDDTVMEVTINFNDLP